MFRYILALCFGLAMAACGDSDPQAPATPSSLSGTVVYEQTGLPAEGVDVVFESMSSAMMMGNRWNQAAHTMTNTHGRFHFEYEHQPMHRYRVGVRGQSDWHMCDWEPSDEDSIVLVIPPQSP
jgi:hypothetical protein